MVVSNNKKLNSIKANAFFSNINNYIVSIDYFDKHGVKENKNSIPITSLLKKKPKLT